MRLAVGRGPVGRWIVSGVALGGAVVLALGARSRAAADPPPAFGALPLPAHVDSLTPLAGIGRRLDEACATPCTGAVYLWTPRMPLSRAGIPHVVAATEGLGVPLALVAYEELAAYAEVGPARGASGRHETSRSDLLAEALLASGALAHAPSLVVLEGSAALGPAILGYKSEAAYQALLARRLGDVEGSRRMETDVTGAVRADGTEASAAAADFATVGIPGAYFRWVPGRDAIAYESGQRVYMLDLTSGESRPAPGYIDFVPTPDGRYFVTPGAGEGGLEFYDADEVFRVVESGRIGDIEPIFTDLRMRDQYPSVGVLETSATRTVYRVLTSWFDAVIYRDYDVRVDARTGLSSVQPIGEPVRPCAGFSVSTPIMSQDGRELAARDEATGTTKIFRMDEGGACEALVDFGVPTSKVAWHATGRSLAFSIPRRGRGTAAAELGIFVFDRDARELTRIPESERASRLAFPDFVGEDAVVYLIPGATARETSYFRVVDVPR